MPARKILKNSNRRSVGGKGNTILQDTESFSLCFFRLFLPNSIVYTERERERMMITMKIIHCSLLLLSVFLAPAYGQTIDECAATDPVVCYYNSKYDEYKVAVCTVYEKYGEFKNKTECVSPSKEDKLKGTITACGCCPDDDDASYCPITPAPPLNRS